MFVVAAWVDRVNADEAAKAPAPPVTQPVGEAQKVDTGALSEAIRRVDMTLSSVTGVLRDGQARGLTRAEHDQNRADMQTIVAALNSLLRAPNATDKQEETP